MTLVIFLSVVPGALLLFSRAGRRVGSVPGTALVSVLVLTAAVVVAIAISPVAEGKDGERLGVATVTGACVCAIGLVYVWIGAAMSRAHPWQVVVVWGISLVPYLFVLFWLGLYVSTLQSSDEAGRPATAPRVTAGCCLRSRRRS